MSLTSFLHQLEQELAELADGLWEEHPAVRLHDRIRRLEQSLPGRYERLARLRAIIERLRGRQAENDQRLKRLAEGVEVYLHVADRENSWKQALELDRARRAAELEAAKLQECERIYHGQIAELQQLKHRLARWRQDLDAAPHRLA